MSSLFVQPLNLSSLRAQSQINKTQVNQLSTTQSKMQRLLDALGGEYPKTVELIRNTTEFQQAMTDQLSGLEEGKNESDVIVNRLYESVKKVKAVVLERKLRNEIVSNYPKNDDSCKELEEQVKRLEAAADEQERRCQKLAGYCDQLAEMKRQLTAQLQEKK